MAIAGRHPCVVAGTHVRPESRGYLHSGFGHHAQFHHPANVHGHLFGFAHNNRLYRDG